MDVCVCDVWMNVCDASICQTRFCRDLDLAVTDNDLLTNPSKSLQPFVPAATERAGGDLHRHTVQLASVDEKEHAKELVERMHQFVMAKRLFVKPMFHQHDKHHR
jgi:hypothetical protein